MMYKTHIVIALFFYLLVAIFLNLSKEFYILLIVVVSSLLPDIDSSRSYINNVLKPGKLVASFTKHRGFWHSIFGLIFIFFVSLFILYLFKIDPSLSLYFVFGYSTHLFCDAITPQGIKPLWQFSDFKLKGKIKTGSLFEYFIFFLLLIFSIYLYKPKLVINTTSFVVRMFK